MGTTTTEGRRVGRGATPLAAATRRRLLKGLLVRAEQGDVLAAEALIRLSLEAERIAQDHTTT
ncbi:hypothetical protein [Azospirillum sp.]|uniref:hypothetical protein n=1 Tax=Azospirillum sp. TaxID=34012 RepID=UPI002D525B3A|nr:hypothetical protein [Azospirillum sp.]HYD68507.1 hypothetical protein [Azospirillum sp.]